MPLLGKAQFPPFVDCCQQAIQLTADNTALTTRLNTALVVLDSTRAITTRLIDAKQARIDQVLTDANIAVQKRDNALLALQTLRTADREFITAELLRGGFLKWGLMKRIKRHLKSNL